MCINAYTYVLGHIYMHYHGGYVCIWFGNFKIALIQNVFIRKFFNFFWNLLLGAQIFWLSPHILEPPIVQV